MHLIALQHVPLEGPARIGDIARDMGWSVEVRRLDQGQAVPERVGPGETLLVLGGPMGVGDAADPAYPFLAREIALLRTAIAARAPVIGVCLGSQLLAHAAGGAVYPLTVGEPPVRHREVGWGAITCTRCAHEEPVLGGLDPSEVVLHWHGDTFDLPVGAELLASTLACPHQFFRLGSRAFGLQFHVEITAEQVAEWVEADADFVRGAGGPQHGARLLADTRRLMPRHRVQGDRLIRNLLAACAAGGG